MPVMPPSSETMLQQAITLHRGGDGIAAEPLYRAVLADQPMHGEANHSLGMQRSAMVDSVDVFADELPSRWSLPSRKRCEPFFDVRDQLPIRRRRDDARQIRSVDIGAYKPDRSRCRNTQNRGVERGRERLVRNGVIDEIRHALT